MLVGGVVVHDQVQLLVVVAAGGVAQEDQEVLVPVPWFAHCGDLAGGDLEGGEQRGGAVPDVIVGDGAALATRGTRRRW